MQLCCLCGPQQRINHAPTKGKDQIKKVVSEIDFSLRKELHDFY